jgi:hypothetical protein
MPQVTSIAKAHRTNVVRARTVPVTAAAPAEAEPLKLGCSLPVKALALTVLAAGPGYSLMPDAARARATYSGLGPAGEGAHITLPDFTGRRDSSGNQRESATLFPQGLPLHSRRACPFIPAPGAALYSRSLRAVLLVPQGLRSSPGHSAPSRSAPTRGEAVIRTARHAGPPPGRDDSALTEVGCCPQAAAACKLKSNPGLRLRLGPQQGDE